MNQTETFDQQNIRWGWQLRKVCLLNERYFDFDLLTDDTMPEGEIRIGWGPERVGRLSCSSDNFKLKPR